MCAFHFSLGLISNLNEAIVLFYLQRNKKSTNIKLNHAVGKDFKSRMANVLPISALISLLDCFCRIFKTMGIMSAFFSFFGGRGEWLARPNPVDQGDQT